jgi:hypothetical protein
MEDHKLVDYTIVHQYAGDVRHTGIELVNAAKDIFSHVKEKAMQCSIKGEFITFNTVEELANKLSTAMQEGFRIAVYDELIGG